MTPAARCLAVGALVLLMAPCKAMACSIVIRRPPPPPLEEFLSTQALVFRGEITGMVGDKCSDPAEPQLGYLPPHQTTCDLYRYAIRVDEVLKGSVRKGDLLTLYGPTNRGSSSCAGLFSLGPRGGPWFVVREEGGMSIVRQIDDRSRSELDAHLAATSGSAR